MSYMLAQLVREFNDQLEASALPKQDITLLKAEMEILSRLPELPDESMKRECLQSSKETLNRWCWGKSGGLMAVLGQAHPAVLTLKKMIAIAEAIVEDRPEPSDEELEAIARPASAPQQPAPQLPGKGCALVFLTLLIAAFTIGMTLFAVNNVSQL